MDGYRKRNPERVKLQHRLFHLRRGGASPASIELVRRMIEATPIKICPVCKNRFGGCPRKDRLSFNHAEVIGWP